MSPGSEFHQRYHATQDRLNRPTRETMEQNTHEINIYGMNKYVKARFQNIDGLFQSYGIFRQQCRPYGIHLKDISDITHDERTMRPTTINGMAVDKLHKEEMSRVIYDYLFDDHVIPQSYLTEREALKRCGTRIDGHKLLFQMLEEIHNKIATRDVTNSAHQYHEWNDLDVFTNIYENFFIYEELDSRIYADRQKLVIFMKALPSDFEKARMLVNKIMDTTGKEQKKPP